MIDGFDEIIIFLIFNKFMYIVGDCFIIYCKIDSNLLFVINLYFWFNGLFVERFMGFIDNKLEFDSF